MTSEQHHYILEKLAYFYGELCKSHNIQTTSEYNWEMATKMMEIEIKINGEDFLLSLLKENKNG